MGKQGTASYNAKCKNCDLTGNFDFVENSLSYYDDQNGDWKTIAIFECRGLEPCEFFPGMGFSAASSVSETVFGEEGGKEPIDLNEGDWAEYDERADEDVSIIEFKSQIVTGHQRNQKQLAKEAKHAIHLAK